MRAKMDFEVLYSPYTPVSAAAGSQCIPRKKIAQGSARGQCPVVLYEADGGRRAQQEGTAGGREEKTTGGTYAEKKLVERDQNL